MINDALIALRESTETTRVDSLIPTHLLPKAEDLALALEKYYLFLNGDGPSGVLNTFSSEHDLYTMSEKYLDTIHATIASLLPSPAVIDRRYMLQTVVKYFYNNRGTVQSAKTFFKIFFDTYCEIAPLTDPTWIEDVDSEGNNRRKWFPYSYVIKTDVSLDEWEAPYRSLIHPIGFRFFALYLFYYFTTNLWSEQYIEATRWQYDYIANSVVDWMEFPPPSGSHSPYCQPGWIPVIRELKIFLSSFAGYHGYAYDDFIRLLKFGGFYEESKDTSDIQESPRIEEFTTLTIEQLEEFKSGYRSFDAYPYAHAAYVILGEDPDSPDGYGITTEDFVVIRTETGSDTIQREFDSEF